MHCFFFRSSHFKEISLHGIVLFFYSEQRERVGYTVFRIILNHNDFVNDTSMIYNLNSSVFIVVVMVVLVFGNSINLSVVYLRPPCTPLVIRENQLYNPMYVIINMYVMLIQVIGWSYKSS